MLHILCCGFTTEIRRVMVDRSPMMLGEFKEKLFFNPHGKIIQKHLQIDVWIVWDGEKLPLL